MQERVTRSFYNEGITFIVYGNEAAGERIIPIDCVPRVLANAEWRHIEAGLDQRLRAVEPVSARHLQRSTHHRRRCHPNGRDSRLSTIPHRDARAFRSAWRMVAICGSDLVRTNDGFRVLEDNLRVPSGVSYMIATRKAVKANLRGVYRRSNVLDVEHYGRLLSLTLRELAPPGVTDPTIALLTPGVYNSAFYEHMFLARELNAELVEGRDLIVNDGYSLYAHHSRPTSSRCDLPSSRR